MVANIKLLLRSYKIYARMDFLWLIRDTKYCLLQILADLISSLSSILIILQLAKRFQNIGGLDYYELVLMLGISVAVFGLYDMFFANYNNGLVCRIIGRGQIDHYLIQPVPLFIQIITRGFAPFSGSSQLIMAVIMITLALRKLSRLTLSNMVSALICSVGALIIIVCMIYLHSTIAFFNPASGEEVGTIVLEMFRENSIFPLGELLGGLQIFFSSVIPVGAIAWIPTMIITRWKKEYMMIYGMMALSFMVITIWIFKRGIQYYVQKGSGRYSGFGHR